MATLLKNNTYFQDNAIDIDFIKANGKCESHGSQHYPIAHELVLSKFRAKAKSLGLSLIDEQGALSTNGERYMYVADVQSDANKDFRLSVGFRNFNDRSLSFSGSCGASVMICCNGMQTSLIVPSRQRHTEGNFGKLDNKIDIIFDRFEKDGAETVKQIQCMMSTPYSDRLLADFILDVGRNSGMSNTNIMRILHEVDNPTLNNKDDNTAWRIMNAATYVTTHKIKSPIEAARVSQFASNSLMKLIQPGFKPLGDIIDVEPIEVAA